MSITINCAGCFNLFSEWENVFKPDEWTLVRVGKTSLPKLADYMTVVTQRYCDFYFSFSLIDEESGMITDNKELKAKVRLMFLLSCLV